jgi:hypothetical protein
VLACVALASLMTGGVHAQESGGAAVSSDRDAQRETLARVLDQPEFQRGATAVLMERLRERVSGWVRDLRQRLGGSGDGSRRVATAFAWIVGLLALTALTWSLVRTLRNSSPGHRLGLAPPRSHRRSSRAWARDALAAHQDGDPREAARCAYHAAIALLEEEGALRQDDARTPREYLQLLASAHRRRASLTDLTARFERAWYGRDAGSPDDTRAMLARLQELGCLAPEHAI